VKLHNSQYWPNDTRVIELEKINSMGE
jgi:hypothetical protein